MYVLNKREFEVMTAIFSACERDGLCLISPKELLNLLPKRKNYTEQTLEGILRELALDDYFQLLSTSRNGEKTYIISLHASGLAFKRSASQHKRETAGKLVWAVLSAVIAFLVGVMLKRVF